MYFITFYSKILIINFIKYIMSEINSDYWLEAYQIYNQDKKNPSHYEKKINIDENKTQFSEEINATISESKENRVVLMYTEKQKIFLEKLWKSIWNTKPDIQEAIESKTIRILKIDWEDKYSLSLNWNKITDYIYDNNFIEVFNLKDFIVKLKQLPDYNWSKVKEAIEAWTIEIKKIPWRDWYAIYDSKVWNLVYITRLDWTEYENIDNFRNKDFFWAMIIWGFIRQWYKIEQNQGLWKLYNKNWEEIPIYSDKYMIITLNAINFMRSELREWDKEYSKRFKEKKED